MTTIEILCFILVSIAYSSSFPLHSKEGRKNFLPLYTSDDDVELLSIQNFKTKIENSSRAWLVEFYASWCGDCQRFAPKWKALAKEIVGWKDMVRIGVLECSDEINTAICNEYEVVRYPTVRYFHEHYPTNSKDLGVIFHEDSQGDVALKEHLIERIIIEESEGRGLMYPNLLPYDHSDLSELYSSAPNNTQFIFLVIEEPGTYLGAQVALDLHKTPNIAIRYAFGNNSALINCLQIEKSPVIVLDPDKGDYQVISKDVKSRAQLKTVIRKFLESQGIRVIEDIPTNKESSATNLVPDLKQTTRAELRKRIQKMGDVVFQMDLETAVRYSLKQEVSSIKIIKGEPLAALKTYLEVLEKYFPFGRGRSSFLTELTDLVSNVTEIEGWKVGEVVKAAEKNGSRVFSTPQRYIGCEGSSSKYRGYPCSLWKLFHYLTVNSALHNVNNRRANPREVLDAMLDYVKHFFGCAACSRHFQEMAMNRNLTEVASLDASILWLWSAHNLVNKRLAGDATEDPEYPKYQFPTKVFCPQCVTDDDGWNLDEVLKYLKHMYSDFNVRYIGSDTTVLFDGLD